MRRALSPQMAVTFTDPRPGLRSRPEGTFIGFSEGDRRLALVRPRYPAGALPIEVPASKVKPLVVVQRQKKAIAGLRAALQEQAPQRPPIIARLGALGNAVPLPLGRIEDPAYLEWVRGLPCCGCGAGPRVAPHHDGPRPVGRKCHDWLTAPLCRRCHGMFHRDRILPVEFDPTLAKFLILRTELLLLLEYFAGLLGTEAERYAQRGTAAATLPPEERVSHLRITLNLLVGELVERGAAPERAR